MKITFILPEVNLSGGTRIIVNHAWHLKSRGHDVVLVSPPSRKYNKTWKQKLLGLVTRSALTNTLDDPTSHLDQMNLDHRVLETYRPITNADVPDADVVVATWWETAEWVSELSPSKGSKAYLVQGHEIFEYLPVERVKATYKNGFHKIVVSQWLKDIMKNDYGDNDCNLVPNTIDFNQFNASDRGRVKNKRPVFGFLYTQASRKDVHIAIDALTKARKTCPHLRVLCFGAQKPDRHLPLSSWFEFFHQPTQDQIPEIYSQCDAWLFTSRSEGFGLPIIEAMACGTPVIGTSAGAAPQYINDQTGALVEATSQAFVDQIIRFAEMENEEWQQKSMNAHQRVSKYTWEDASLLFEKALNNAIRNSSAL